MILMIIVSGILKPFGSSYSVLSTFLHIFQYRGTFLGTTMHARCVFERAIIVVNCLFYFIFFAFFEDRELLIFLLKNILPLLYSFVI